MNDMSSTRVVVVDWRGGTDGLYPNPATTSMSMR